MNLEKYRTFLTAAGCRTFFEAADELFLTPATVSKHIASLEKELGVTLFRRTPQGIFLTEEGKKRVPLAQQLIQTYDALMGSHLDGIGQSVLPVLASSPPSRHGIEKFIQGFSEVRPEIRLDIREMRGATSALLNGECELAFVSDWHLEPAQLRWIVIQRAELGVVMPAYHPLSGREQVSLWELQEDPFIMPAPELGVLSGYLDICRQCGFVPRIRHYCYREDSILFYVSCGEGVSLMPKEVYDHFRFDHVAFVPMEEKFYSTGVLARNRSRELSPAGTAFWDYVRKVSECEPSPSNQLD